MKRLVLFLFILLLNVAASAGVIEGTGYGKTENEAKSAALSDLASVIKVQVYSKYERSSTIDKTDSTQFTRLITNVPLINPSVTYSKEAKDIKAVAVIDNPEVYKKKLAELALEINSILDGANSASAPDNRYRMYESALNIYAEYDGYTVIMIVMGIDDYAKPKLSSAAVRSTIISMQTSPPSLEIAAEILLNGIDAKKIFVEPIRAENSDDVTPFAAAFGRILSSKLNSPKDKNATDYTFECAYNPINGGLILSCGLLSGASQVSSSVVKISEELLKGLDFTPKEESILSILKHYDKPDKALNVELKVSTNTDSVVMREGEQFTLLLKCNEPVYIYIVRYMESADGNFAHLLRFGADNAPMRKIEEKDVGKWVSLGRYKVTPPFGVEVLQLYATTSEPINFLPDYAMNENGRFKVQPSRVAEDIQLLFNQQSGPKTTARAVSKTVAGGND